VSAIGPTAVVVPFGGSVVVVVVVVEEVVELDAEVPLVTISCGGVALVWRLSK
jgi:hypothetical protein